MVVGTVLARGQITLPVAVRRAADIQAGDVVAIAVTGTGMVEIRRLPRLTLAEALDLYRIEGHADLQADREAWEAQALADC